MRARFTLKDKHMNETISKTIAFLRFPLIVMVVLVHANMMVTIIHGAYLVDASSFPFFALLSHILSVNVASISVPLFFFISGYLFFARTDFTNVPNCPPASFFIGKLKRRVRTLLVPYLLWNTLCFGVIVLEHLCVPGMMRGDEKPLPDYTLTDWLGIYIADQNGLPADQALWFVRALMVFNLLTPLVFFLVRKFRSLVPALTALLWILQTWIDFKTVLNTVGLFFYVFGAYFSIQGKDFLQAFVPHRKLTATLFVILVIADAALWQAGLRDLACADLIYKLGIVAGSIAITAWAGYGIANGKLHPNAFLASTSFFIYAYHGKPIAFLNRFVLMHLHPLNGLTLTLAYILIPTTIILLGIALYAALKRCLPRFTNIITGGR